MSLCNKQRKSRKSQCDHILQYSLLLGFCGRTISTNHRDIEKEPTHPPEIVTFYEVEDEARAWISLSKSFNTSVIHNPYIIPAASPFEMSLNQGHRIIDNSNFPSCRIFNYTRNLRFLENLITHVKRKHEVVKIPTSSNAIPSSLPVIKSI